MPTLPIIPQTVTVHLGAPNEQAENVTVSFTEYIKNVASNEIYPNWPDAALRANILAQITFALNRIYTEYYPSRGYDFDITNNTLYDQAFRPDGEIFGNISEIVDEIFNNYIVRNGSIVPLYAQFCDGVYVQCSGLSQWGSVRLAEQGMNAFQILQYYFGDNIRLVLDAAVGDNTPSYPGVPLRRGSFGDDVLTIKRELNRIALNYPALPRISRLTGVYDFETEKTVTAFQEIFNLEPDGVVGKATWYKIKQIFAAVKRLSDITGEGLEISEVERRYTRSLRLGDSGVDVEAAFCLFGLFLSGAAADPHYRLLRRNDPRRGFYLPEALRADGGRHRRQTDIRRGGTRLQSGGQRTSGELSERDRRTLSRKVPCVRRHRRERDHHPALSRYYLPHRPADSASQCDRHLRRSHTQRGLCAPASARHRAERRHRPRGMEPHHHARQQPVSARIRSLR